MVCGVQKVQGQQCCPNNTSGEAISTGQTLKLDQMQTAQVRMLARWNISTDGKKLHLSWRVSVQVTMN